jgi:HEAT repeat protein
MLANDQIYSCGEDPMGHPVTCSEAGAAAEALRTLGTDAVEPLIYAAHHARPGVRAMAVGILASIGDPRANEVMLAALRDRDAKVRLAAMAWPAPTSDLSVQSRIALLLHDPDERVRTQAVAQLEEFANDRRVVNAFRVAGKDSSSDVRNAVARSMEK